MDWTLEDGLTLVRALQPKTRDFGYHLTLGGSVLNIGRSSKDLDLFFLPMDNSKSTNALGLLKWLGTLWGKGQSIGNYGLGQENVMNDAEWVRSLQPRRGLDVNPLENAPVYDPMIEWHIVGDHPGPERPAYRRPQAPQLDMERVRGLLNPPRPQVYRANSKTYTYKYKFIRAGKDRIDVFII